MTPKEAIELLKDFKAMTGQAVGEDIIKPIEQALNEHEALKKDVPRFMKLVYKPTWLNTIESADYDYLKNKLSKVGKEA